MSFLVCFLYAPKAAAKMVSKFVAEDVTTDGNCDIVRLRGLGDGAEDDSMTKLISEARTNRRRYVQGTQTCAIEI